MGTPRVQIQRAFSGEVSQSLRPRGDVARVAQAVQTMRNGWSTRSGSWQNRPGFRYVALTKEQAATTVLRRFFFNDDQAYAIEVGAGYMRFYQAAEALLISGTPLAEPSESGVLYLGAKSDDLPFMTNSVLTGAADRIKNLGLVRTRALATKVRLVEGATLSTWKVRHSTRMGVPGQLPGAAWATGVATLTVSVEMESVSDIVVATLVAAKLYRINTLATVKEGPKTATETNVNVLAGGDGTYTFNFGSVSWAGPFLADDRLVVELEWSLDNTTIGSLPLGAVTYDAQFESSALSSAVTLPILPAEPWDPGTTYLADAVVCIDTIASPQQRFFMSDEVPSPTPSGFLGTSPTYFKMVTSGAQGGSRAFALSAGSFSTDGETAVFVTNAGLPGWTEWPLDSFDVSVRLSAASVSGAGASFLMRAVVARLDSGNVVAVATTSFTSNAINIGTLGPGDYTMHIPFSPLTTSEWGTVDVTDRLAIAIQFSLLTAGGSGTAGVTLECGVSASAVVTPSIPGSGVTSYRALLANTNKPPDDLDNDEFWTSVLTDVIPWDAATSYVPGQIVSIEAVSEFSRSFDVSNVTPAPDPSGFSGTLAGEPYASLTEGAPVSGGIDVSVAAGASKIQLLMTEEGAPGWTTWPVDSLTVELDFSGITGTGALNVTARAERATSLGARVAATYVTSAAVDIIAAGDGPQTFTCPIPTGGWGSTSTTDRLVIVVTYSQVGGTTGTATITCASADSTVSTPALGTGAGTGLDYFYAVATHTNKNPSNADYHDDFWYPLVDGLLEIPTSYAAADLVELDFQQSQDVIAITHRNYPPHELAREADETQTFGRWTNLPTRFVPFADAPTAIYATVPGSDAGDKKLRYKVTFVDEDTGAESVAGACTLTRGAGVEPIDTNLTDTATVTVASAESTDLDLIFNQTAHTLLTGDEIHILTVATVDTERAHENAKRLLQGAVFPVTKIDADNFSLDGTKGQLTLGPISDPTDDYPQFTIVYGLAYVEFDSFYVPKGDGARRIELSWTAPASGAKGRYLVYRTILGEEDWGLLGSTTELHWADEGDTSISTGDAVKAKAVADTTSPPPNYKNPFRYGNWPRASSYHGQRQWFGGTELLPLRVWGSVIGDFKNFSTRQPITADDAVDFTITSGAAHEIQRLVSAIDLLILTTGGVIEARGNGKGLITPTDGPNLATTSYVGAANKDPLLLDDALLYIHARKSLVWERRIDLGTGGAGGYEGQDITVYHPNMFAGYTITQFARAEVPHSMVFAVRSDGTLLGLTYLPRQEVAGWHRHDTLNGSFLSIATVPEGGEDVLYAIVRRTVGGVDQYSVERMDVRSVGQAGTDPDRESFFLDGGITYDSTATTAISGLDHLEGEDVYALADGAVVGPFTVASGAITLATAASIVHVGLLIEADLVTENIDRVSDDLSGIGTAKRVPFLTVFIEFTRGLLLGEDGAPDSELKGLPTEHGDIAGALISDERTVSIKHGYNRHGRVHLAVRDPLPVTVTALVTHYEEGGLPI